MDNSNEVERATDWLALSDQQDYEATWQTSSKIFQSAIELDDWRKSLQAARSPLGSLKSRVLDTVSVLHNPDGAPDGDYVKVTFNSSFEHKLAAIETITLIEESDGKLRTAGFFIK